MPRDLWGKTGTGHQGGREKFVGLWYPGGPSQGQSARDESRSRVTGVDWWALVRGCGFGQGSKEKIKMEQ